jgi:hypothetical protein
LHNFFSTFSITNITIAISIITMADTQPPAGQLFVPPTLPSQTASQSSFKGTVHHDSQKEEEAKGGQTQLTSQSTPPTKFTRSNNAVWNHLTATIRPTLLAEAELILLTIFTGMQGRPFLA